MKLTGRGFREGVYTTGTPSREYFFSQNNSRPKKQETFTSTTEYPQSMVEIDMRRRGWDIFQRAFKIPGKEQSYRFTDGRITTYTSLQRNAEKHKIEKFIVTSLSSENFYRNELTSLAESEGLNANVVNLTINNLMFKHDLIDFSNSDGKLTLQRTA